MVFYEPNCIATMNLLLRRTLQGSFIAQQMQTDSLIYPLPTIEAIKDRMQQVKLRLNEEKTHIVYCKDYRRKEKHEKVQFDFLGFSYQPGRSQSKYNKN